MNKQSYYTKLMKHPLHPEYPPERAEVIDFWHQEGRNVGLILEFGDEHRASMKYTEIEALQVTEEVVTV